MVESEVGEPGTDRSRSLTLRAQMLLALAVVAVVVTAAVGWSARTSYASARAHAAADARFTATLAASGLTAELASLREDVLLTTGEPDWEDVLADPAGCALAAGPGGLFPAVRLDVVRPDGRVVCTSKVARGAPAGATHAGDPWVAAALGAREPLLASFADSLSGEDALAIAGPVRRAGGDVIGVFAIVLTLEGVADAIAAAYGGPDHFRFAFDTGPGLVHGQTAAPVGRDDIVGRAPVEGRDGWSVIAALELSVATASARAEVDREIATGAGGLAFALLLLVVINRRLARPIARLRAAVDQASRQVEPAAVPIKGPTEVRELAETFNAMVRSRAEYESRLAHQALHDPLTSLPNRVLFMDRLAHALRRVRRVDATDGVMFVDLDGFKRINDTRGHDVGDRVLVAIAQRLRNVIRPADTIARLGGDEFVVLCESLRSRNHALTLARRIEEGFAEHIVVDGDELSVTASIGVALAAEGDTPEDVLRNADAAMHEAKAQGRACAVVFDDALRRQRAGRAIVESELRRAIHDGELVVHYQPEIDLGNGVIVAVEALVRWEHPIKGLVPAIEFVDVAEDTGLVVPLGEIVLAEAARQAAAWAALGHSVQVAVNVSPKQLARREFLPFVERVVRETGVEPAQICIEVTESTLLDDRPGTLAALARLRERGMRISIDDFGTGYSSLAYLRRLEVDELKVDRAFVEGLGTIAEDEAVVAAVVSMAGALGLEVVAEGVETEEQLMVLARLGCNRGQGYLFARPQPADLVGALLGHEVPVLSI